MNLNTFDSQQYERYLSPFGKKVLGNLMKILQKRNECNRIQAPVRYNNSAHKRCVLTFDDSHIPRSLNLCEPNVLSDKSNNINVDGDNAGPSNIESAVITTSNGLLKTGAENLFPGNVNIDYEPCIAKENVLPEIEHSVVRKDTVGDCIGEAKVYIEWDDIYDKQLLEDLSILDSNPSNSLQQNRQEYDEHNLIQLNDQCVKDRSNDKHNDVPIILGMTKNVSHCAVLKTLDVPTISDTLNFPITTATDEEVVVDNSTLFQKTDQTLKNCANSKIPKSTDLKKRRLKRQNSSKITDSTPKQIKKPSLEPKLSFRKQTNTKAVKTWLNSVENEVFDDFMETHNLDADKQVELETKNVKKTVQAQLTNKGGIMKYDKPKTKQVTKTKITKEVIVPTKNNDTGISAIVKEKRWKSKFIPPIKSQIPVKELSYTIICFNDNNLEEHLVQLNAVKDEDIDMILIFRNGFCQLNSHYTEDTCTVEGVMFQINKVFYYWKSVFKEFCSTMQLLIKKNTIVCYDGKNLLKYLVSQHNIEVDTTTIAVLDVQIGASLIDPDNTLETFTDVQKMLSFVPEYTIATECVQQKSAWYLTILSECFVKLRTMLIDSELWKVFVEIEMRVLPIVTEMELWGVRVDTQRLKAMEEAIVTRMKRTEEACHAAAGRVFQVNSTVQVRSILYDELQLDSKSNVRIKETLGKGEKSTSECMLRSLISLHPLPKLILEYRHLHKAHATFLIGISNQVKDGVVRPTWVQTAAATGRIASNNPNLQAIPKAPFSLVLFPPDGKEEENPAEPNQILNFRSVYVARDGYTLLAADFKHIECRVFAYAAADTSLLDALASPDLFRVLAARWLNKSEEAVSSADRERTKRIVYASLYGAGTRRLMQILDVSYDQTLSIMASFNRTFPSLKSFGRAVVWQCAQRGLVTLGGRARRFAHITSADFALRSHAERQAVNFVVQGSAADLCKLAMSATQRRLRQAAVRARLLLQIHDELVWEVRHEDLATAAAEIKSAMEGIGATCGMAAALPVAISTGPSWGDMVEYPPTAQP